MAIACPSDRRCCDLASPKPAEESTTMTEPPPIEEEFDVAADAAKPANVAAFEDEVVSDGTTKGVVSCKGVCG